MKAQRTPLFIALLLFGAVVAVGAASAQEPAATSCVVCHSDADLFDEAALGIVEGHAAGVHAKRGLGCHDCHGGNPDLALADDIDGAMDAEYAPNPYLGTIETEQIPGLCGGCHSDPEYMRRFDPDARVDQLAEYWTSRHGKALRAGDLQVATCVSCHGAHDIQPATSQRSGVHPTRVAETCAGCHADPQLMAGYTLDDGSPLPIDQHSRWQISVHGRALLERGDLFAPTCNDCHGNHGAAPPGLESIAYVCGQCHGREAELFRASAKREALEEHRGYLEDLGDEGCAACHEAPEPAAELSRRDPFAECSSCHGNHAVVRPTLAMLDPLPATPCVFCHEGTGPLATGDRRVEKEVRRYELERDRLLAEAATEGLEGEARFNWLVDQALRLAQHNEAPTELGERRLRSEFGNLFRKFRIGKTYATYPDPVSGETVELPLIRCGDCHAAEPLLADEPAGLTASAHYVERIRELTSLAARAERALLTARRGGVATRDAQADLDQAVDAQIQLEVLLHTFEPLEGAFAEKHAEGVEHAAGALALAEGALDELTYRRTGLAISLLVIVLVLFALALKIREISGREAIRHLEAEADRFEQP